MVKQFRHWEFQNEMNRLFFLFFFFSFHFQSPFASTQITHVIMAWDASCSSAIIIPPYMWATSWENLFMPNANNKGAFQSPHLRSLISTFVVRCLDSMIYMQYPNFRTLAGLYSWAGNFVYYLVANPEDRFLVTWPMWESRFKRSLY